MLRFVSFCNKLESFDHVLHLMVYHFFGFAITPSGTEIFRSQNRVYFGWSMVKADQKKE